MQEPILANLQGYTVLVRTPEGTFVNLRAGSAVCGPGFEKYQEDRTLTRVAPSYTGPIVYESPVTARRTPEPAKVVTIQSTVAEQVEVQSPAEYDAVISALLPDEPAGGFEEPVEELEGAQAATPEKLTYDVVQRMTKRELSEALAKLGLASDGSRAQMVSRIAPYMDKG